jgi:transposase-like protein
MLSLAFRTFEFLVFHLLILIVDRVSRLPRASTLPELMRLYRENLALKAQNGALLLELDAARGARARVSMRVRAAQVFAYLLTRGNHEFQDFYLAASVKTLKRWAAMFRRGPWRKERGPGRPPLDEKIVGIILTLKKENPLLGARRIREELRRMGIAVSEPTIQKVLREHGYHPRGGRPGNWERFKSAARDALWAMDFFVVRTVRGAWLNVLLVIDIYTREILDLRVHDGWDVDSTWTVRVLSACMAREKRRPAAVMHDHGVQFYGQFERQLRVMEIEQRRTPVALPFVNGSAERAVKSVRAELLNHVRVSGAEELQWYLDEYRRYYQTKRANQALDGQTPAAFGAGEKLAEVIDLQAVRRRRLVRRSFAHGLLNSYELVEAEPGDGERQAA